MSHKFQGVNLHLDTIKRMEYLTPIDFHESGNIKGVRDFESKTLKAGFVGINTSGDVSGVRNLHATGTITSDKGMQISEFTTDGKVQSGGPFLAGN